LFCDQEKMHTILTDIDDKKIHPDEIWVHLKEKANLKTYPYKVRIPIIYAQKVFGPEAIGTPNEIICHIKKMIDD